MMTQKKGQMSTQFNWIFVLLVGGFILIMFITLSSRQQGVAEVKINAQSLEGITTIFDSARTGNSFSTTIDITELTMGFHCEEIPGTDQIYSDYTVNSLSKRIPGVVAFAPPELTGKDLVTWTYAWDMPFKVMNFFYIANSKVHVYFYLSNDYADFRNALQESFTETISHSFISETDELLDANDDLTIVVIDDSIDLAQVRAALADFRKDVQIVRLRPSGKDVPPRNPTAYFGLLDYFTTAGTKTGSTEYFGLASLYGAILSGDKEYYECTMKKAAERLKRVACLYKMKYDTLFDENVDPDCRASANNARNRLTKPDAFGSTFCSDSTGTLSIGAENFDIFSAQTNLTEVYIDLRNLNRQAIGESCETLY